MTDSFELNEQSIILTMEKISKFFPGVVALNEVDLVIKRNEIVGLVGENGAGKTVLMSIMIGLLQPDEGMIIVEGNKTTLRSPAEAQRHGIGMVFQESSLIPNLTIMENLFLCHEIGFGKAGLLSLQSMRSEARNVLSLVELDIDVDLPVAEIGPEARQMVEIARMLWLSKLYGHDNPIIILDEPTTVLADRECETLFSILRTIKSKASIILISHRLQEVVENSDRIVILKNGNNVRDMDTSEMESSEANLSMIEQQMVGQSFSMDRFHENKMGDRDKIEVLRVESLSKSGAFETLSFSVHEGEIVSLVGLVGSGKEEVCNCINGIDRADTGAIFLDGQVLPVGSPRGVVRRGVGHIPIDRRRDGLAMGMSVVENLNLLVLDRLKTAGLLSPKLEKKNTERWIDECHIKTPSIQTMCSNLSGGNQQKTVIAKWLSSGVRLLILDHPTRGIDVGAKDEIYKLMRKLAKEGLAMIIMCDTLEEDIGLANRMLLMKDGEMIDAMDSSPKNKPSPQKVLSLIN